MKQLISLLFSLCILGLATSASANLIADYGLNGDTFDDISLDTAPSTDVAATADRFGAGSGALDFNGSTSLVSPLDVGLDDYTQDFSVSLWLRPDAIGAYQGVFSNSTGSTGNNGRWHTLGRLEADGKLLFVAGAAQKAGGEILIVSTGMVTAAEWNHVAFLYDVTGGTGTLSIYLNGNFEGSSSRAFNPTPLATTETWRLGAQNDDGTPIYFFSGALDDFQIYDHVLSVPEIQALAVVPEPSPALLQAAGLLTVFSVRRRVRRSK